MLTNISATHTTYNEKLPFDGWEELKYYTNMQNTLVGSSEKHSSKQSKWDTSYTKFAVWQKVDTKIYN